MTEVWLRAALWLGLALAATLVSIRLRVATALSEIVVETAQLLIGVLAGTALLGTGECWVTFLSGAGAVLLTFLAGAELDPVVFRARWRESAVIGLVSFAAPFFGRAAFARSGLGWTRQASGLAGVALSTTSVAVVYAVMLELGLNSTGFGEAVLAACFVTDLGTVLAKTLGLWPVTRAYRYPKTEAAHATLLMSTGLTFGSISALFGPTHGVIDQAPYSYLIAAVIGSAVLEAATRQYEAPFHGLHLRAKDRGVSLQTRVAVGHPADQIIKTAAAQSADLIVVGHRGRSAIREWVFGSISRRIVAHAACSALVARPRPGGCGPTCSSALAGARRQVIHFGLGSRAAALPSCDDERNCLATCFSSGRARPRLSASVMARSSVQPSCATRLISHIVAALGPSWQYTKACEFAGSAISSRNLRAACGSGRIRVNGMPTKQRPAARAARSASARS
jgi:nucleotide-binding universal stress UspA family protein